jgi:hypothetical protein
MGGTRTTLGGEDWSRMQDSLNPEVRALSNVSRTVVPPAR